MKKEIKYLVIHCTATPEGRPVTGEDIRRMHLSPEPEGRGWKQVGYSDLIRLDGSVENLVRYNADKWVDPWEITNGVGGINSLCRHVVYAGGLDSRMMVKDTRTIAQKLALEQYVMRMIAQNPTIKVAGHRQFDKKKACPSFDVAAWLKSIGVKSENIYLG